MLPDPLERELGDALRQGLPGLAPEWEQRALSAVAGVRPRRHPNLLPLLVGLLLLLLAMAVLYAMVRHYHVEGRLQWRDGKDEATASRPSWSNSTERYLSGDRAWQTGVRDTKGTEISPMTHRQLYTSSPEGQGWPPRVMDIMAADLDGAHPVNLTARLGGMNCNPRWSRDGRLVAFSHREPVRSGLSCHAPPQVWVMRADGSGRHRVGPPGTLGTNDPAWSPDGSRLLMWVYDEWPQMGRGHAVTVNLQDKRVRVLRNVGIQAVYSPDSSKIVSRRQVAAETREGGPGVWNRLLLTDADGTHPRVVAEQFVSDADVAAHQRRLSEDPRLHERPAGAEWRDIVLDGVAPQQPVWSPRSDRIAFLAALPFAPKGAWYSDQLEVWVYDVPTGQRTRLTNDHVSHTALQWK